MDNCVHTCICFPAVLPVSRVVWVAVRHAVTPTAAAPCNLCHCAWGQANILKIGSTRLMSSDLPQAMLHHGWPACSCHRPSCCAQGVCAPIPPTHKKNAPPPHFCHPPHPPTRTQCLTRVQQVLRELLHGVAPLVECHGMLCTRKEGAGRQAKYITHITGSHFAVSTGAGQGLFCVQFGPAQFSSLPAQALAGKVCPKANVSSKAPGWLAGQLTPKVS